MFRISAYLHRHPDSGIFYFRLTIPPHLRHTIGKREIKKSLETGLRADAIPKAHQCYVEAHKLFQRAEKRMSKPNAKTEAVRTALDELEDMVSPDGFMGKITVTVAGQKVVIEHEDPKQEAETAARLLSLEPASKTPPPPPAKERNLPAAVEDDQSLFCRGETNRHPTAEDHGRESSNLPASSRNIAEPGSGNDKFQAGIRFQEYSLATSAEPVQRKIQWKDRCRNRAYAPH